MAATSDATNGGIRLLYGCGQSLRLSRAGSLRSTSKVTISSRNPAAAMVRRYSWAHMLTAPEVLLTNGDMATKIPGMVPQTISYGLLPHRNVLPLMAVPIFGVTTGPIV